MRRLPSFLRDLYRSRTARDRREIVWLCFTEAATDLPYACLAVLSLPAVWRLRTLARQLNGSTSAASRRSAVWGCFSEALIDVPYIAAGRHLVCFDALTLP